MAFTTHENPYIQRQPPKPRPTRHTTPWDGAGDRTFETTGERRPAKKGEFVLGLFGVAQATNDTTEAYPILREIKET